jgi:GAF domain-containing protein
MVELKRDFRSFWKVPNTIQIQNLKICQVLDKEISYYNWTGFYFKNGDKDELILGPYVGAETDHTIIPFGKGICGQVAVSARLLWFLMFGLRIII